jgi:hypothetical protein
MSMMGITLNFMSTMAMGLVAGVLVDDAIVEIENIVRHMRMGKSAYQASLDAADEIGLAVLATTMAIVAVFLPVALMPGIAGQYFKAFGFTVVVSVLMSLLVARMITPLSRPISCARTASSRTPLEVDGPLSEGPQLEPRHDQGRCAAREAAQARAQVRLLRARRAPAAAAVLAAFVAGTGGAMKMLGKLGVERRDHVRARGVVGAAHRLRRGQADRLHRPAHGRRRGFAEWHGSWPRAGTRACTTTAWRWSAPASSRCCSASSCSARCRMSFFPPQNDDFRAVNITWRRAHAQADRGGVDRVAAIVSQGSERRARVRARQRRQRPGQHRLKKDREVTSTEFERNCRRRSPRSPTRASASRARTAAGPIRFARHHALSSAATIRCS